MGTIFSIIGGFYSVPLAGEVAGAGQAGDGLRLVGSVELQAEKYVGGGLTNDNLDQLYGRVNIGSRYAADSFSSEFMLRAYPEGLGYEPLTRVTFDPVADTVVTAHSDAARFQVVQAWVRFHFPLMQVRFGRILTNESRSMFFGNYIDLEPDGGFYSRLVSHNGIEFSQSQGIFTSQMMVEAAHPKLNRGFMRFLGSIQPRPGLLLRGGYKANVFDKIYDLDLDVAHRVVGMADWEYRPGFLVYAEGAWLQRHGSLEDRMPALLGLRFPGGRLLTTLTLEAEFDPERQVKGEDKPVAFNIEGTRALLGRVLLRGGVYSDPRSTELMDLGLGFRVVTSLD